VTQGRAILERSVVTVGPCPPLTDIFSCYRSGVERIPSLERAPSQLGADLWELESKRVQRLVQVADRKEQVEATSGEGHKSE
jgi:hypothetical protein